MSSLSRVLAELVPRLEGIRVMVVGDLISDRYVYGHPARLSREAPVVVSRYEHEELIPGGAANAASNLLALGARVLPVGVVGDDDAGRALLDSLASAGSDVSGILCSRERPTVTKTRYLVGEARRAKQQIFRIDQEPEAPPPPDEEARVLDFVRSRLDEVQAVLLSDYGYGLLTDGLISGAGDGGGRRVVTADSRYRIRAFRGVGLATPNQVEVESATGLPIRSLEDLDRAGRRLMDALAAPALLVTRGNEGMSLFRTDGARLDIPAMGSDEVADVSGAGDTVISVATLALAAGAPPDVAAHLANVAAGVVVMKLGAATCTPQELLEACKDCP